MKRMLYFSLAVVNLLLAVWVIGALPETVPVHFNLMGEVDRLGSRWWYLLTGALPLLVMGLYLLYIRLTRHNERIVCNRAVEDRLIPMIALALGAVGWVALLAARSGEHVQPRHFSLIFVALGLLMVYMSNLMGKVKQNRTLGFKILWTLKDEVVWNKTHRLMGYAGVALGAVMIAGGLAGVAGHEKAAFILFFGALAVFVLLPVFYARGLYKRRHEAE